VRDGVRVGDGVSVAVAVRVGVTVKGVGGVAVAAPWNTKRTASTPTNKLETVAVSS
jgi:hypothetical protein